MSLPWRILMSAVAVAVAVGTSLLDVDARATNEQAVPLVTFIGGGTQERAEVAKALTASRFDWSPLAGQVVVHIGRFDSVSTPGHVWLNARLLRAGRFAWGVVLHEFAHQVDFLLLRPEDRTILHAHLGGRKWFPTGSDLPHDAYACERFASTFAWSFWPSPANSMQPTSARGDESGAMPPRAFRSLVTRLLSSD